MWVFIPYNWHPYKKREFEDLPCGPVARFCAADTGYMDSIPGQGTKILYTVQHGQKG